MNIKYDDSRYIITYGRAPRGRRIWWFAFEGHEIYVRGTFTEAKKACNAEVQRLIPADYSGTVTVLIEA